MFFLTSCSKEIVKYKVAILNSDKTNYVPVFLELKNQSKSNIIIRYDMMPHFMDDQGNSIVDVRRENFTLDLEYPKHPNLFGYTWFR